ncbi:hypothetical protein B0F90DRAFT_1699104 [Multifurca ochricompacta]|uniref:Uncharacterized protein n=1 Tax=Multifurca ochricompacta TaxID=376703 RepID=A0AAD4M860_9AGAM|nr:hypothetical protein B0F90DRAFT_1699104 [Multifurca ochricompacta]
MLFLSPTLLFLFALPLSVLSVSNSTNTDTNTCNPAHNGLATGTLQYNSDCNATTWCDNGICRSKGCRRDEFPLGYSTGEGRGNGKHINPPEKCSVDKFCPDEGSQCVPKTPVGQPCQFDRDDSCLGPDNFKELKDTSGRGLNVNGSICLNFVCQFANITAGSKCEIENTGYIAYGPSGEFVYVVSRDNCRVGLYCDTNSTICIQQKSVGGSCSADKECSSYNCLPTRVCGTSPSDPRHFPVWVYAIIGIGIFGGMIATLVLLFFVHGRQREDEREKRLQYWREQNAFRQNILQMHETARASIFSAPGSTSRRSALFGVTTEDSQIPMLQHAEDSGSYEVGSENEQLVMRTPYTHGNKI